MTSNKTDIIAEYQKKCTQHLQSAALESDEYIALSRILQAFIRNQTGEPDARSLKIVQALEIEANSGKPLPFAPHEGHARAIRVRKIVAQWAKDLKRDVGLAWVKTSYERQ